MLRYGFLPQEQLPGRLAVVMADPSDVQKLDEIELLLGQPVEVRVGTAAQIEEILQKSESSQRVLDEATEDFRLQLVQEDEEGEEVLSIDRISADTSPIIKLVDSTVFNAIQRRASDIHIEALDTEVVIKYRIDGALYHAMEPIDKRHHQTIISRIKVMAELDIAEKRIPQDGRFKLRVRGRTIDFRVSVIPSVHGEDCVIRILDKESMSREFKSLRLDILGIDDETVWSSCASSSTSPTAWCWSPAPPARARPPRSTPVSPRSSRPRTRSSPSRTRSSTSSAAWCRSRSTRRRASPSLAACARSCATTPTRSWWARSATRRRRRSRSSRRSPVTWCSPPCTPTTCSTCSAASST